MIWEMEVEDEKELESLETVLGKFWDLHDKLSDAIHSISRAHYLKSAVNNYRHPDDFFYQHRSQKGTDPGSDESAGWKKNHPEGFAFVKGFSVDEEDESVSIQEAKSLYAIRTALENLEDQLELFHNMREQQRVEKEVALARLEQSRLMLAMRLANHRGKKYKFIEEAQALVSPESLFGSAPKSPGENTKKKCSSFLLNVLLSSFSMVKKSLAGGILGNAALVAFSLLALMQMQQTPRQEDVLFRQTQTKVSRPQGSSSRPVMQLDVLSARG